MLSEDRITSYRVRAFKVPTDTPEADGTCQWDKSTLVLVELTCGNRSGLGYTYADLATAKLAHVLLAELVYGQAPSRHPAILQTLYARVRNLGIGGISMMAISAIDNALWDLRARQLDMPLVNVLGRMRDGIRVYGSGGFTSYDDSQLRKQFSGWAGEGLQMVKMKVGARPDDDPRRAKMAREAIGPDVALFVDANGAYTQSQALRLANNFAACGVRWFEEPVSADDRVGMRHIRERAPAGMDIAAGEYGYTAWYFRTIIEAQAVTVLQADCTRCGISGFLDAAALCWAANLPLSSHCAPSQHLHVCCAVPRAIHMEYFHDHVRIERMFFDGFCEPIHGQMHPDLSRPGVGLTLKESDAGKFEV